MKQSSVTLRLEMLLSRFIMLRLSSRLHGTRITIPQSSTKKGKVLVWRVLFDGERWPISRQVPCQNNLGSLSLELYSMRASDLRRELHVHRCCLLQDTSDTPSSIQLLASSIPSIFSIANEVKLMHYCHTMESVSLVRLGCRQVYPVDQWPNDH